MFAFSSWSNAEATDSQYEQFNDDDPLPTLYPTELPDVLEVKVLIASEDINAAEDGNPALIGSPDCSLFQVTPALMKSYFSKTSKISDADFMHRISWASCRASGTVMFSDGKEAEWRVMQSSGGILVFPDGERMYLFCEKCSDPFVPS